MITVKVEYPGQTFYFKADNMEAAKWLVARLSGELEVAKWLVAHLSSEWVCATIL